MDHFLNGFGRVVFYRADGCLGFQKECNDVFISMAGTGFACNESCLPELGESLSWEDALAFSGFARQKDLLSTAIEGHLLKGNSDDTGGFWRGWPLHRPTAWSLWEESEDVQSNHS